MEDITLEFVLRSIGFSGAELEKQLTEIREAGIEATVVLGFKRSVDSAEGSIASVLKTFEKDRKKLRISLRKTMFPGPSQ